jgi:glycosyltransferase involved in cell wall biosynthesis
MANGIPVVCTKTPGLLENCADAALYVDDRENIDAWVNLIECLDNPGQHKGGYEYHSLAGRARAKELCSVDRLFTLENFLHESLQDYKR